MERVDVIVVGAGLAGCSVAWHAAQRGLRVLVLEQGVTPGAEGTAQNAGMVRRLGEDPHERALAMRTVAFLEEPPPDWAGLTVSRKTGALLGLGHEPGHLNDGVAHLRSRGVRVEACDRPAEVAPVLLGAPPMLSWYLPDEHVARVPALMDGFLRGMDRMGVVLRCGVRVTGLQFSSAGVTGVRTDHGDWTAAQVVLAAGAWTSQLVMPLGLHRPLVPLRRTCVQTAAHPLSTPHHPWVWIDDAGIYARPESGHFLVSSCDEGVDWPAPGPGSTGRPCLDAVAWTGERLNRWMPGLSGVEWDRSWSGLRTFAPDRRPYLGADPEAAGLWWAAGLGGFGVSACWGVGEAVGAWLVGDVVAWLHTDEVRPDRHHLRRWSIRPTGELHRPKLIPAVPPGFH